VIIDDIYIIPEGSLALKSSLSELILTAVLGWVPYACLRSSFTKSGSSQYTANTLGVSPSV